MGSGGKIVNHRLEVHTRTTCAGKPLKYTDSIQIQYWLSHPELFNNLTPDVTLITSWTKFQSFVESQGNLYQTLIRICIQTLTFDIPQICGRFPCLYKALLVTQKHIIAHQAKQSFFNKNWVVKYKSDHQKYISKIFINTIQYLQLKIWRLKDLISIFMTNVEKIIQQFSREKNCVVYQHIHSRSLKPSRSARGKWSTHTRGKKLTQSETVSRLFHFWQISMPILI